MGRREARRSLRGRLSESLVLTVSFLALAVTARSARSQEVQFLRVTDINGFVEVGFRDKKEKRSRGGVATSSRTDEFRLEERLHLTVDGYAYHPRFLRYSGGAELDFYQEPKEDDSRFLRGGRWYLGFLEEHPYGLAILGSVRETEVDRSFARTYDVRSQLYGTRFFFRRGPLPFQLAYDYRDVHRFDTGSDLDEKGHDFSFLGRYDVGARSNGRLEYFGTVEKIRDQDIFRQRAFASNTTYFDPLQRKRLTSNAQFRQQDDTSNRIIVSTTERFDWRHRDTLSSHYDFNFRHSDLQNQTFNEVQVGAGLAHQLYESLHTAANVFARWEDASFGLTRWFGGTLTERYTKRLSSWGRLGIAVSPFVELIQQRPDDDTAFEPGEQATLPASTLDSVFLRRSRVFTAGVRLWGRDCAGDPIPGAIDPFPLETDPLQKLRECDSDTDFVVAESGELSRTPGSAIEPGQTLVVVEYTYGLPGRGDILSGGVNTQADLFYRDWLRLYAKFDTYDQSELSGDIATRLDHRTRYVAGVSVQQAWMTAGVEVEKEDSTFRDFRGVSEYLSLFSSPRTWWRARISGRHSYRDFTGDEADYVNRFNATATLNARIFTRGLLEVAAEYQLERWGGDESNRFLDVDGVGVRGSLTWHFRQIRVTLGGAISRIDRFGLDEDVNRVYLRVRREF